PPEKTTSLPPELTVVPSAVPPADTLSTPPLSTVKVMRPPESTFNVPPLSTMMPLLLCPLVTADVWPLLIVVMEPPPRAPCLFAPICCDFPSPPSRGAYCSILHDERKPPLRRCRCAPAQSSTMSCRVG